VIDAALSVSFAFAATVAVTLNEPLAVACACAGDAMLTTTPSAAIPVQTALFMTTAPVEIPSARAEVGTRFTC
jgi:hypothetical protein